MKKRKYMIVEHYDFDGIGVLNHYAQDESGKWIFLGSIAAKVDGAWRR